MSHEYIIEVDGLKKHFPLRDGLFGQQTGELRAVDGVSFKIRRGTIFGTVGESGSGKPPLAVRCWGCMRRPPVASSFAVRSFRNCHRGQCARCARKSSWCFRIPTVR